MALRANKIAVLGDLHGKWNQKDNEFFDASDYDLLLFVGDLGIGTWDNELDLVRSIGALQVPTLIMPGNNDAEFLGEMGTELESSESVKMCGYSSHPLQTESGDVTLIAARPCAMGGSEFSFGRRLEAAFGVTGIRHSAGRLKRLVDEATTDALVFIAHNGPRGLGGEENSPWARDFRLPEEMEEEAPKDWGDRDLADAISHAKSVGKDVLFVVAGHMHRHPRGGKRPLVTRREETSYVNGAVVPRIVRSEHTEMHHFVELNLDLDARGEGRVSATDEWREFSLNDALLA